MIPAVKLAARPPRLRTDAKASGALVPETMLAAVASFGAPEEVLTGNPPKYVTWRSKSEFSKMLAQRSIKQILATPRAPRDAGHDRALRGCF
jgi:hypothetical protein